MVGQHQAVSFPWVVKYLLTTAESSITPDMLMCVCQAGSMRMLDLTENELFFFSCLWHPGLFEEKGLQPCQMHLNSLWYLWDVSIWHHIGILASATARGGGGRQAETCSAFKCQVGKILFPKTLRESLPWQILCDYLTAFFRQLCLSTPVYELLNECGRGVQIEDYAVHFPQASSCILEAQEAPGTAL